METALDPVPSSILYVEDDALLALTIVDVLEDAGYSVISAPDGQSAIAALEDRANDLAALVTDVRLPGLNGWIIARHARKLNPAIPVVYVSGDSGPQWSDEGVPGSTYLQKPFANGQLVEALEFLLRGEVREADRGTM